MQKTRERLIITGRLADDAKLKSIDPQRQLIEFVVVLNFTWKTKNNEKRESTKYYTVELWYPGGKKLENVVKYLAKGALVTCEGQPKFNAYVNQENETVCKAMMVADTYDILIFSKNQPASTEDFDNPDPFLEDEDRYPIPDPAMQG